MYRSSFVGQTLRAILLIVAAGLLAATSAPAALGSAGYAGSPGEQLISQGGPVIHGATTHAVYWGPASSWDRGYKAAVNRFLRDVAADSATGRYSRANIFALTTQYTDRNGPAQYSQRFGGAVTDTTPYPTDPALRCRATTRTPICMVSLEIEFHLETFIAAHHLPTGLHQIYFVFTPKGVGSGYTTETGCAYHGNVSSGSVATPFSFDPYIADQSLSSDQCVVPDFYRPNHNTADPTLAGVGHELVEVLTDPLGAKQQDAWRSDPSGYEIADQCETVPASFPRTPGFSQRINGHLYFLAGAWSNLDGRCMYEMVHYAVPRLTGQSLSRARVDLAHEHLSVGVLTKRTARSGPRNRVLAQLPVPGSWLLSGGRVNLVVSK